MAEAADGVHLAQYAAGRALRAIATQFQCTIALRAARVAHGQLDQGRSRHLNGGRARTAR